MRTNNNKKMIYLGVMLYLASKGSTLIDSPRLLYLKICEKLQEQPQVVTITSHVTAKFTYYFSLQNVILFISLFIMLLVGNHKNREYFVLFNTCLFAS